MIQKSTDRWPALDGLRGVICAGVFVTHVNTDWLPGALLFMDTFFVMSSFLITRLLLRDWLERRQVRFAAFYARRFRRLYPALLIMVTVVTLFASPYLGLGAVLSENKTTRSVRVRFS